jgi:predicted anti-sigma-YlaC factor YlaD
METMNCKTLTEHIDDYLEGALDDARMRQIDQHIGECATCQQTVNHQRELQSRLAAYGKHKMPRPDTAFYDRAIARAAQAGTRKQRNRWIMTGFGGAVAALFMVWIVSGAFFTAADIDDPAIPTVTMALASPQTFNLVFSSASPLVNASMTVTLPDGIEIQGFAGQREITWRTSLKAGDNTLPLTLVATTPAGGELLATLQHEDDDKVFRLQVTVI